MPIEIEAADPVASQGATMQWITNTGRHVVTVNAWDFVDSIDGQDVVFDLRDDAGRRQVLAFGLNRLELSSGRLLSFLAAVVQRHIIHPVGMSPKGFLHMLFNEAAHRRVALIVERDGRGKLVVMDWEPVPQDACRTHWRALFAAMTAHRGEHATEIDVAEAGNGRDEGCHPEGVPPQSMACTFWLP